MERTQISVNSSSSTAAPTNPVTTSSSNITNSGTSTGTNTATSRQQTVPQISLYGGIADRQTVQAIQQALHRQPGSAAQYLQQMYAAQQQHLMLQTAALQQQHINLAAVQQASIVAGRQNSSPNENSSQQTLSSQTTIKLANTPVETVQLLNRANTSPVSITQQAVLLGNSSSSTLTASQAQMYLRAQMAQQNNLVRVARSLGRAVPLSPQLIFTPTGGVTTIQPEVSSSPITQQTTTSQNVVLQSQQGAVVSSLNQSQLQRLSVKQSSGGPTQIVLPGLPGQVPHGANTCPVDAPPDPVKTSENAGKVGAHAISVSHNVTTVTNHPLLNSAYAQIQTHQLLQQNKQQFLIQHQSQLSQGSQMQLLHSGLQSQTQAVQTVTIQPALVLPKSPGQQATIFHSTVSPHMLNSQTSLLTPKAIQVQVTAASLQIQPPLAQTAKDADKDKTAAREDCLVQNEQQLLSLNTQEPARSEQCVSGPSQLMDDSQGPETPIPTTAGSAVCVNGNAVMTSGSGNSTPNVTGSTPHNGHSKTPQAVVKPQILTHVIEGFVIQEGAEPFPVERPSLLPENIKKQQQQSDFEKRVQDFQTADAEMEDLSQQGLKSHEVEPTLSCELCGKVDMAVNFKRSKRFCSTVCAKRYNVGCTKRMGLFPRRSMFENPKKQRTSSNNHITASEARKQHLNSQAGTADPASSPRLSQLSHGESSQCSDTSSYEEHPSPASGADHGTEPSHLAHNILPSDPAKWNVKDVYEFICSLPGCQEIAEEFRSQEIDGQALLLLKEDHLMSTMNIKLGPALKIFARISMLRDS